MPLPASNIAWPPKILAPIQDKQAEFDAWYTGDPDRLAGVYQHTRQKIPYDRTSQYRGGVVGAVARFWWGRPNGNLAALDTDKLHVPLAADICQASADLLYAEAPTFTVATDDKAANKELDGALEGGLITQLAEGNEIGAALGDAYYRTTWDDQIADRSFITTVHADAAWPEFRWGHLVAVTFWWVVKSDDNVVLRHLERHELAGTGGDAVGVILHGLYQGTRDNLGRPIPLADHPATMGLKVDAEGRIDTKTPGLAVVHVPNQRPQRRWRQHPIGANLGRSDLDGVESHLDKLDMVYSSWMRDIRLAKARLIVPNYMLSSAGPGQGLAFDTDQDVFTSLNAPPREDGRSDITPQQFDIRVEQHQKTAEQLVTNILRSAGYGPQTFGEAGDVAQTATETDARDRRSNLTRDRKIRAAEPALRALLKKKLAIDAEFFGTGVGRDVTVTVDFPDVTQASPESLARTNTALFQAQSASVKTRVKIQHPDWDEKAVDDEAAAILSEFGAAVPDPTSFRPGVDDTSSGSGSGVA